MLAYILALAVGFGSLAIYMAAFFFPEVHRKSDFPWSGVGLFYALILWVCAGRITGAVLLGQIASVALLGWFAWQTLTLRRELTPVAGQTPIPNLDIAGKLTGVKGFGGIADLFGKKADKTPKKPATVGKKSSQPESESASSVTVVQMKEYGAVETAIASPPDKETSETVNTTVADVANTAIEGDFASNSANVAGEKVADSQETSKVEPSTVSQTAIAPDNNDDEFDGSEDFAEITQEKQFTPSPAAAVKKPSPSSTDFGSLLANLKKSLVSLGGFGKAKTKPVDAKKEAKTSEVKTSITEAGIPIHPTADIDDILESKSKESVPEVVPETLISLTKTSESMTAEVTEETGDRPSETTEVSKTENLTAAVDALETETPTPPVEIAEIVSEHPTETLSMGETSEPEKVKSTESSETLAEVPAKELEKDDEEKLV